MDRLSSRLGTVLMGVSGALLVTAALALIAVTLWPEGDGRSIVVIGDTHVAEATEPLQAELEGDHLVVDAISGSMIRAHVATATALASSPPDVVLFDLGTSDHVCAALNEAEGQSCGDPDYDLGELEADLAAFVDALPEESCVVAVTIEVSRPDGLNRMLEEWRDEGSIDAIADWAGYVSSADVGAIRRDYLLYNERGSELLARYLREQIDEHC